MSNLQATYAVSRRDNVARAVLHRNAIAAIDKLTSPTPSAAKNDNIVGVMAASAHYFGVSAGNRYGSATPVLGSGTITPTLNKTVDLTIAQVAGAEWYDIFFSTAAAPLWVGRITEAMRANGCAITAVGTSAAVYQVETATVVGTITTAGRGYVQVTCDGMPGSPLHVPIEGLEVDEDASAIAVKIRAALNAVAVITDRFTVGGENADVSLTKLVGAANDSTLNILIKDGEGEGACVGITEAATSANTTWGIDPGKCSVRLVGTGVATNAVPFTANNAYTPASVTGIDCDGKTTAHIYVSVAVTDLRSAPTLSIVPFIKNYTSANYAQGTVQSVPLLTAVGTSLMQAFDVDVKGASGLAVLVDAITGQGTAATIHVELS